MQALSREKNFPTTISCLLDRNITILEAFLGEIGSNYINYHGMRDNSNLMLNIIDLPHQVIDGKYLLVQRGKKNYYLVTVK